MIQWLALIWSKLKRGSLVWLCCQEVLMLILIPLASCSSTASLAIGNTPGHHQAHAHGQKSCSRKRCLRPASSVLVMMRALLAGALGSPGIGLVITQGTYSRDLPPTERPMILYVSTIVWRLNLDIPHTLMQYHQNERPILFVCHSLGGLVCQDALLASRASPERHLQQILNCTRGILFLGTPHSGTDLAVVGQRLSRLAGMVSGTNIRLLEVLRRDSEVLARIQDDFHSLLRLLGNEIRITCVYEEVPIQGIGEVSTYA